MAGTNILVRQKDLIAGSGISITPDTTSGNVTIAATNTAIDESRLIPTGGKDGDILGYQEGADRGNGADVRLLLQNALTDSANGNVAPAAVTAQGVTLTGDNNLLFDGNDSHVTAVLATDEIFVADKEWTIDFWMKPTANSSEWNYILTENRGDWGSHSIGLTWNKSKSVLEQDTGGYVASVIKAPNWPNNSIACAANEWHFVAVEKQKTATGWSLNYYLNGAIWLQVAFTGEFVPFTSDNPFWFGGKTTDSGRWFKGEANKLRVTAGARYGGKAFAVPDRLIDYAAPAGQPVWIEGIDRSRLLPENPNNGDIPCYSDEPPEGVNYNDANTVLLLQGSSDNTAAAPTAERLNGIVTGEFPVQADGSILVNGTSNYITFNDADARRVFSGEFTLETYIKTTQFTASGKRQDTNWCVVYRNGGSVTDYQWLLLSDFFADAGKFGIWPYPQMSGETFPKTLVNAEFQHVAIDVYMVDGVRKFTMYRNGVPYHTGNYWSTTPADWSSSVSAAMRLFGEGPSGGDDYLSNASVMSLRVSNIARYKGVSFDPPADGKYLNPPVGEWGKLNKAELVQSVNGVAPDESGNVTVDVADESRLLPELATIPEELSGHPVVYDYQSGIDEDTLCLLHLDDATWADATGKNTVTQNGSVAKVSANGYFDNALDLSANLNSGSLSWLTIPWLAEYENSTWTMEFFAKPTKAVVNFMFFSFGNSQGSYLSLGSQSLTNLWLGNGSGTYTGSINMQLNTWYWFVVQYDGAAVKVYVDGTLIVQGNFEPNYIGQDLQFGNLNRVNNQDNTFIGYLDEFRWSKGLRYPTGGMTAPTEPYGTPAKSYKVSKADLVFSDSTRLLPENPADGDIPCFDATATVGGGNDSDTVLLIQPVTSNNQIVNQAVGGGDRVVLQNTNVMVFDTGEMTFAGNAYLSFNPNSVTSLFLKDNMPWTLDLVYNVSSKSTQCLFGRGTSPRMDFLLQSNGNLEIGGGPSLGSGWPFDTDVRLTFEVYMEGGNQKYTAFRDGTPVASGTWSVPNLHDSTLWIGWDGDTDSRKITGRIKALRMTDTATHNGAAFTPDELPWTEPQVVGEWSTINKSVLVRSVNSRTPDSSGAVTLPVATASAAGLMAAADKNALDNLRYATQAGAIDFNIFSGLNACYILLNGAHTNGPLTGTYSGTLDIISDRTSYVTTQRFTQLTTNKSFIRTYAFDTSTLKGTWSEWSKVIVNTDIATASAAGLMTATDKVKLDALQQGATYIDTATDFDTYKTTGSYFLKSAAHTNGPLTDSYAGTLVAVGPSSVQYATQYFTQLYTNKTFVRTYSQDNSAWSAWRRIIVDTDLATTTMAGLMPAADKAAIAGLTTHGIYPNALAKSGAVDFNEVIDHGFYFIGGDTPHLNYPETYQQNGGTLQVIRNGNYLTQMFIPLNINKAFIRSCLNVLSDSSERTFSAWRRPLIDTDITESKAQPGYFKLPRGTIVQYGKKTMVTHDEESCFITFPVAFPTMFLSGTATASSGTLDATGVVVSLSQVSATSMTMVVKNHPATSSPDMDNYIEIYWVAIGY